MKFQENNSETQILATNLTLNINFLEPINVGQLRSFLGLTAYYRKFIKNYASVVESMKKYLRGKNGNLSQRKSWSVSIKFSFLVKKATKEILSLSQRNY